MICASGDSNKQIGHAGSVRSATQPDWHRPVRPAATMVSTTVTSVTTAVEMVQPLDWRQLSALAGLDERELREACRRRRFARGEVIFHEGDPAGALHLLDVGHVAIRLTTVHGDVAIIDVLQPGDAFGERALVEGGGERGATAVAVDRVETLSLDVARFARFSEGRPETTRFLLFVVSDRLRRTNQQLLEARFVHADERLHRCLCRLAEQFDAVNDGVIPLTQADIAAMTGVTRSTANRLLRQAERDGVISTGRGRVRIVDGPALRRRAGLTTTL
jgi:CRP/FNR family cyclic AMP-dependent transcriptional regulator